MARKHHVSATINGDAVDFLCEPQQSMLDVLRDEIELTGTKEGCATGDCGACSITVDGVLVCSCLMLGVEANGRTIETIEGIAAREDFRPLLEAFVRHDGGQCGFCTPGFAVAAYALLKRYPRPQEFQVRWGLVGHLCRCNAYEKIVASVLGAAQPGGAART